MLKLLVIFSLISTHTYSQSVNDLELLDLEDASFLDEAFEENEEEEIKNKAQDSLEEDFSLKEDLQELEELESTAEAELEIIETKEISQDDLDLTSPEDLNFEVINEISEATKNNITNIVSARERAEAQKIRYNSSQLRALKIQLSDIAKSPVRNYYIPKGAKLFHLKKLKPYRTTKGFFVKAHTLVDFNKQRYILNNKGELTYSIPYNKIADVERVSQMYRKPHNFTRLKPKIKVSRYDKQFDYSILVNTGLSFNNPEFTRNLVSDARTFAPQFHLEFGAVSKLNHDYHLGITSMFENTVGQIETGGLYTMRSYGIGPIFKSKNFWENYRFSIQGRLSIFSQINIDEGNGNVTNFSLSENALQIALEKESRTERFGTFVIGYQLQRKWFNATASGGTAVNLNPRERSNDTIGIYVGHKSDWIW
ncbi:MAG: hypothetical protein CME65_04240 [Halobacteriovoraceae bacterium]|nr:hypothetical protein [Halobacteriovoraceae bacterium]